MAKIAINVGVDVEEVDDEKCRHTQRSYPPSEGILFPSLLLLFILSTLRRGQKLRHKPALRHDETTYNRNQLATIV